MFCNVLSKTMKCTSCCNFLHKYSVQLQMIAIRDLRQSKQRKSEHEKLILIRESHDSNKKLQIMNIKVSNNNGDANGLHMINANRFRNPGHKHKWSQITDMVHYRTGTQKFTNFCQEMLEKAFYLKGEEGDDNIVDFFLYIFLSLNSVFDLIFVDDICAIIKRH